MKNGFKSLIKFSLLSITAFKVSANVKCVTHGQCQNIVDESTACYIVELGKDNLGKKTCEVRCFTVPVATYCAFEDGKNYGVCKDEDYKTTDFDIDKPDCSKAIPANVIETIFSL